MDSDTSFIWLSEDNEYAAMYGNSLVEIEIDKTLITSIPYYELVEIADFILKIKVQP